MRSTPPRKKPACVYCGKVEGTEAEHVFPRSWYPDTTPPEVQRLTVPACHACNTRFKKIEESVGHDLIMATNLDLPEAAGVYDRISRGWRLDRAKNEQDRSHRAGKLQKILRGVKWMPPDRTGPRLLVQTEAGITFEASPARQISNGLIRELEEKFIRGLHYAERNEWLGPLEIGGCLVTDRLPQDDLARLMDQLNTLPIDRRLGPGLWYRRYWEAGESLWAFRLWGHIMLLAYTKPARVAGSAAPHSQAGLRT